MTDLYSSDSMAFMDSMDPTFSTFFGEEDSKDSWVFSQPTSFDLDDYLISPQNTTLDPILLETSGPDDGFIPNPYSLFDANTKTDNDYFSLRTPSLSSISDTSSHPATPTEEAAASPPASSYAPTPAPAPAVDPPKRKRGRPRLSESTSSSKSKRISKRQPHNEVERKYREGLNAELERLRQAVPMLPQSWDSEGNAGKPSKATVLATAIEYLQRLEKESDRLRKENDLLRTGRW